MLIEEYACEHGENICKMSIILCRGPRVNSVDVLYDASYSHTQGLFCACTESMRDDVTL